MLGLPPFFCSLSKLAKNKGPYFVFNRSIITKTSVYAGPQFSFRSCKFRVQKSKEGTGRIVMWRLGIKNSYTMETTFGGSTLGVHASQSVCVCVCACVFYGTDNLRSNKYQCQRLLYPRKQEGYPFHHTGPEISGVLLL